MAINSLSFGNEQQKQSGVSPIVPALVLGGGAVAGVKFLGPKKEMTKDVFEKQVLSGKKIEYTGEQLTEAEKKVANSLANLAAKKEEPKEGAKKVPESKPASEKELKKYFGKKEEISPYTYIKNRYHTTINGLAEKIKKEEALTKSSDAIATHANALANAQKEVKDAKNLEEIITQGIELEKKIATVKKAGKSTKALEAKQDKLFEKLDALVTEKDLLKHISVNEFNEKVKAQLEAFKKGKKNLTPEQLAAAESKIETRLTIAELKKYSKARLKTATERLAKNEADLNEQVAKVSQMKADLELAKGSIKDAKEATKAAGKGAKKVQPKITKSSISEITSKVKDSVSAKTIEKAFEVLKGKLAKVKPSWGIASVIGAGVAAATMLIGSLGSKDQQA